jgi:cell division protein FtsW
LSALRANLFLVALGLSLLGAVMIYSATSSEFGAEYLMVRSLHVALGTGAFLMTSRVRYTAWRRCAPGFYFAVLLGLVLVLIPGIGIEIGGARRWFNVGGFGLQPAEFAKLAAVLTLSVAMSRLAPGSGIPVRPLVAVGLLYALVLVEPDFGTSVVILSGVAGVLWASELRTRDLLLAGGAALAVLAGVMFLEPYRRERFLAFLDPWAAPEGSGYQVVQSMFAIRAGNLFGAGHGAGDRGAFVPEVHTDMIFALIGEELGLVGMLLVIAAFGFLSLAGLRVAFAAPTVLGRCMAAGITTMFAVQATFNMGASMGAIPLSGMTLPFVSYGGSSLVVSFAAVGILHRISEDGERAREAEPFRGKSARLYARRAVR